MKAVRAAWWIWALVPFVVVACLLLASAARADEPPQSVSATDSKGNRITLFNKPCFNAPVWLGWRKASVFYEGKTYEACWRVFGSTAIVLDSAGDASPVPLAQFKRDETL